MKKKILIIGNNSFVAKNLYSNLKKYYLVYKVSFEKFKKIKIVKLKQYNSILNCSINKKYLKEKYNIKNDLDVIIANKINKLDIKFIFLSTRKVYKPKANIKETDKVSPISNYGRNKIITENKLTKLLKSKLLILRISNLIGFNSKKRFRKVHTTFLDILFENVKKGYLIDNENLYKDFISINQISFIIHKLIKHNLVGLFNVSAGKKIFLTKLVGWLLKYNTKKLINIKLSQNQKNRLENKSFYLNNFKLKQKIKFTYSLDTLKKECFKISKTYFYEKK
tara:strand:- start:7302 stop:8141 length:840 start_codon:yes stop_codon:yes gene_type:complete